MAHPARQMKNTAPASGLVEAHFRWTSVATSPFIFAMVVPLVFLDLCLEIYQHTVFPLVGITLVRRGDYIGMDRHRLPYLPFVLKLACAYCGYANGLLHYAARIAGATEAHFCPIKHQAKAGFHPTAHQRAFAEYGDAEDFRKKWDRL